MKTVSESECLDCRRMAICVYLISGRHFTAAIADRQTGKCTRRSQDHANREEDLPLPVLPALCGA